MFASQMSEETGSGRLIWVYLVVAVAIANQRAVPIHAISRPVVVVPKYVSVFDGAVKINERMASISEPYVIGARRAMRVSDHEHRAGY
jgi:predicted histidine transporter YuiF (NhaC family)